MSLYRLQAVLAAELDERRREVLAVDPRLGGLVDHLVRFVLDGGKRIRPEFLFCGWRAAAHDRAVMQGDDQDSEGSGQDPMPAAVITVAAALELIQACALLHDDVIDRSDTRRGAPSTHRAVAKSHADAGLAGDAEHFGVSAAVLLGDLALAWADDLFAAGAAALGAADRALPVWRAMRTEVLSGQLLDLQAAAGIGVDPAAQAADALRVNRFKTAAYTVERPLHLGAALAAAGADTVTALRAYGADVGVAFQLRDDLLGVFGDPAVTGKPAGDDLLEGKRTLLLATARSLLGARPELLAELDDGIGAAGADAARLAALIDASGARAEMERRISDLVASGIGALDAVDAAGAPVVGGAARLRLVELAGAATARAR